MRSRASDGFIMNGQANMKTQALSVKSINPTSKRLMKASDGGTAKISHVKTLLSKTAITLASSLSKNTIDEAILRKVSANKTCDLNPRASAYITFKRKAGRRRSYTSLLMTRSMLVEECTSITKQDKLPSIDNEHNQLKVAEYVEEIYQYYWVMEVHFNFDLMHETLFLSIMLFDQYLSQVITKKDDLQFIGLTALLLASKYEEYWHPTVIDLISISAESYTREQMLEMEMLAYS